MIKPLETHYAGFRFRSRMEARWAVFMDALSIPYQYEPEAYQTKAGKYLPDFYIPHIDMFMEVKSPEAGERDYNKIRGLTRITGKSVAVVCSPPSIPSFGGGVSEFTIFGTFLYEGRIEDGEDLPFFWCECPHCRRVELQFDGRADRINCDCARSNHGDKGYNFDSPRLVDAYNAAKSERFGVFA